MSEPFLAEIRMVGFDFAPRGWAECSGQILPINQNQSLYSLLGTTYGGDGRTAFALPDLRGRSPIHFRSSGGTSYQQGQRGGAETHTLSTAEMPSHTHALSATSQTADSGLPTGHVLASSSTPETYRPPDSLASMQAGSISDIGGGQAHNNMQPYLTVNFCIALQGLFPSRN